VNAEQALQLLRSAQAVRERSAQLLDLGLAGELAHFTVDQARLAEVAQFTAQLTRERYPDLRVPPHSRFGHFDAGGVPRMAALTRELSGLSALERARRLTELVVVSVLLDAGAGDAWRLRFQEHGGTTELGRSEGLAVASLAWARAGGLSSERAAYQVDAAGLMGVTESALAAAFQVGHDNPLVGVSGRVLLLRELGRVLGARRDVFGAGGGGARIGGLIDTLLARADQRSGRPTVAASDVLSLILDAFAEIWPGRLRFPAAPAVSGAPLGDVWHHAAVRGEGATDGLLPLHKLSQWLCYSLLLPLEVAGISVTHLNGLTGLAEYRNGGLFIDGGVLIPRERAVLATPHAVDSELIVEWRGLTVALLDRVAPLVRATLGMGTDEQALPLAAVLEGGTWAAGRALAARARPGGGPPLQISSDGTVF